MTEFILILTAFSSKEEARHLAEVVVGKRQAAAANILGPLESTYWWKGTMETGKEEWLCLIRTRRELYEAVEQSIQEHHPYEVPGIIALPILAGSQTYLDWIVHETSKQEGKAGQVENEMPERNNDD